MNAYTLARLDLLDDTEAPPIKYTPEGKISKEWTKWNFIMNHSKREINNPEPDWQDAYKQDYLVQNPQ